MGKKLLPLLLTLPLLLSACGRHAGAGGLRLPFPLTRSHGGSGHARSHPQ